MLKTINLLLLALAGDADASIRLGMSSYSNPRRRRWQDWNGPNYWGNAIRAVYLLTSMISRSSMKFAALKPLSAPIIRRTEPIRDASFG
jgi:hypothetical protein